MAATFTFREAARGFGAQFGIGQQLGRKGACGKGVGLAIGIAAGEQAKIVLLARGKRRGFDRAFGRNGVWVNPVANLAARIGFRVESATREGETKRKYLYKTLA